MVMRGFTLVAIALAVAPAPAFEDWQLAQSRHFVVYSDDKPESVKALADTLNRHPEALIRGRSKDPSPISATPQAPSP